MEPASSKIPDTKFQTPKMLSPLAAFPPEKQIQSLAAVLCFVIPRTNSFPCKFWNSLKYCQASAYALEVCSLTLLIPQSSGFSLIFKNVLHASNIAQIPDLIQTLFGNDFPLLLMQTCALRANEIK